MRSGGIYLVIVAALAAIWAGAASVFDLKSALTHYEMTLNLVKSHQILAILAFVLFYTATAAVGLPIATVLTLLGGALFGVLAGTLASVLGATLGACLLFIAAQRMSGSYFIARLGPWMARLQQEFQADAATYLLVARLAPVFPFVVVNIAAALLGTRFKTFIWTTFIGIIPGGLAYALIGSGLNQTLLAESRRLGACSMQPSSCVVALDPATLLSRETVLGLAALAAFVLISIPIRRHWAARMRASHGASGPDNNE